jgi:hypothetical protein
MDNNKGVPKYYYMVYGLRIKSEVYLPELTSIDEPESEYIDATISYGKVSEVVEGKILKNHFLKISKSEFFLFIKGVAYYYVAQGNTIVVEPEELCNKKDVKTFLLGSSLGMMLIQRSIVAIHGGTVIVNKKGIIITGQSGAGKSTLISSFVKSGYEFLADDVSAIGETMDKNFIIHPSYPQQKLCRDAIERMGFNLTMYSKIDDQRDKYAIPLRKSILQMPVSLSSIFEINIGATDKVEVCEVFGAEKIKIFLRNIYRMEFYELTGVELKYFNQCLNIVKKVRIYRVTRPKDSFSVKEQMELILNTLKSNDE